MSASGIERNKYDHVATIIHTSIDSSLSSSSLSSRRHRHRHRANGRHNKFTASRKQIVYSSNPVITSLSISNTGQRKTDDKTDRFTNRPIIEEKEKSNRRAQNKTLFLPRVSLHRINKAISLTARLSIHTVIINANFAPYAETDQ